MPGVSEAYLAWTFSGEPEFQEREGNGPWITHRIKKGSFFLTTGGGPYECRWKALTPEPFLSMMTFVELPLLKRALEEVFGAKAEKVRLRDLSAFTDPDLNWLMEGVRAELLARRASALRVQGLAQLVATHLARNYAEIPKDTPIESSSLPGFKLKQVTDWIEGNLAEEFDLERLAKQAGLSKFHFHRLFTQATGMSPAKYQLTARMMPRAGCCVKRSRASWPPRSTWASPAPATLRRYSDAKQGSHRAIIAGNDRSAVGARPVQEQHGIRFEQGYERSSNASRAGNRRSRYGGASTLNQMKTRSILSALLLIAAPAIAADMSRGADNFYVSDKVTTQKINFKNQYYLTVAGNLFVPKNVARDAKLRIRL